MDAYGVHGGNLKMAAAVQPVPVSTVRQECEGGASTDCGYPGTSDWLLPALPAVPFYSLDRERMQLVVEPHQDCSTPPLTSLSSISSTTDGKDSATAPSVGSEEWEEPPAQKYAVQARCACAKCSDSHRRSSREVKSRLMKVDGNGILKANNYDLEIGEPSVFESELSSGGGMVAVTSHVPPEQTRKSKKRSMQAKHLSAVEVLGFMIQALTHDFTDGVASVADLVGWMLVQHSHLNTASVTSAAAMALKLGLTNGALRSIGPVLEGAVRTRHSFILSFWPLSWVVTVLKDRQISAPMETCVDVLAHDHLLPGVKTVFTMRNLIRLRLKGEEKDNIEAWLQAISGDLVFDEKSEALKDAPHRKLAEFNRVQQIEAEKDRGLCQVYLARHLPWLRPFLRADDIAKLEQVAKQHGVSKGACDTDRSWMWKSPVHAITETPYFIQGGELREHQLEGISWLRALHKQGCPGILGDEMGLGKTLQTITFLGMLRFGLDRDAPTNDRAPSLIVCPLSVLNSWMSEFKRWCPQLKVALAHTTCDSEIKRLKSEVLSNILEYDAVITTYEVMRGALRNILSKVAVWRYFIMDEAQRIKNEESDVSIAARRIRCRGRLLLTGTPLQNNLHELWSLLNFILPQTFRESEPFDSAFDLQGKVVVDNAVLDKAHYALRPFLLRRLKSEVELNLPGKKVVRVSVPLSEAQRFWYRQLLIKDKDVISRISAGAAGESGDVVDGTVLRPESNDHKRLQSLMMQLRKCCNHPFLFDGADPNPSITDENIVSASGKMRLLDRLLPELKAMGHRVVIFSQFTRTLDVLEDYLIWKGYELRRLDGNVSRVRRTVSMLEFQMRPSIFAFLMTTRAGGLGVTLTAADTVIMFDSDWNPQVDLQAHARCHRIGQSKPVIVYQLVTHGTVEERMVQRANKKLYMDHMVNRGSTNLAGEMDGLESSELVKALLHGMTAALHSTENDDKDLTDEELAGLMDRSECHEQGAMADLPADLSANSVPKDEDLPLELDPQAAFKSITTFMGENFRPSSTKSVKDIAQLYHKQRSRKSRIVVVDGESVLALNMYDLEDGEPSVMDRELKRKKKKNPADTWARKVRQCPGRDYDNEDHCLNCWDGGDLIVCDLCPLAYHPTCAGLHPADVPSIKSWKCSHHTCNECHRAASKVGGLLFNCAVCPGSWCEDHLPIGVRYIGECGRFTKRGVLPTTTTFFVFCSVSCREFAHKNSPLDAANDY
jgi:SWI/SNF-related matrix-associated actin-dependent regulator of chromatin subfamily A member 5